MAVITITIKSIIVVTDLLMPGMDGIDLLLHMKSDHPEVPVLAITGVRSTNRLVRVRRRPAETHHVVQRAEVRFHQRQTCVVARQVGRREALQVSH